MKNDVTAPESEMVLRIRNFPRNKNRSSAQKCLRTRKFRINAIQLEKSRPDPLFSIFRKPLQKMLISLLHLNYF